MTIDKAKLKALAEATRHHLPGVADPQMIVDTSMMLALLGEIDLLESYLCECEECGGEGQIFLGTYSSGGRMEPPEPDLEKCRGCDGKGVIGTPQQLHSVIAERDQLKAENEALRKAMNQIMEQVDGNIRETVRDCVNGRDDVQDIYGYCNTIEEIIGAAMTKEAGHDC
ncbi:hypothetical protein OH708_08250 [Pseudomonas capsici]|uniref:hypothetical protein n=1 Tax=Pseudomonas capsici TaxID=2810614 RepID=UPI0021F158A9|nr:hypothetical protein [Pseudomonas capsici]MCV4287893.1 hypothetical protein [Pseudomonas capsici]